MTEHDPPFRQGADVVPLGKEPPPQPVVPPTPPGRAHGLSITGMAVFALLGIVAMFLFITINWTEDLERWVIGFSFLCAIGFIACASAAVFTAARDTYPPRARGEKEDRASS